MTSWSQPDHHGRATGTANDTTGCWVKLARLAAQRGCRKVRTGRFVRAEGTLLKVQLRTIQQGLGARSVAAAIESLASFVGTGSVKCSSAMGLRRILSVGESAGRSRRA